MNVGILWQVAYPWDIRMEKIIKVLTDDGHEVHLVCKGKDGLSAYEASGALKIHRIRAVPVAGLRLLSKLLSAAIPINPYWYAKALKVFRNARIDRLIVRDLPMALLAGLIGKRLGVPVFFDMAENYPAALIAYNKSFYKPFLFCNGWLPRQYEKLSLRYMAHVFVVAYEQTERLVQSGVDRGRISVVMNTPDVEYYVDCIRQQGAEAIHPARGSLLYIGKVDAHRGIDLLVRAMPKIRARYPAIRLVIVGEGSERKRLEKLAADLGVVDNVVFQGWLQFESVPGYIAESSVCLIPHIKSEHTETTVPNKIFDYMTFGKPVIVSDCTPLARIIRDAQCGQVFRSGDAGDLSEKILALLADPNLEAIGARGKQAVADRYHWKKDAAVFLAVLKNFETAATTAVR
jgi:glycosyltransferase involved in cell wall biosynthesis